MTLEELLGIVEIEGLEVGNRVEMGSPFVPYVIVIIDKEFKSPDHGEVTLVIHREIARN